MNVLELNFASEAFSRAQVSSANGSAWAEEFKTEEDGPLFYSPFG